MKIETGRGTIPLITLVGIWSISALSALPGLAVSPILGQMSAIFPPCFGVRHTVTLVAPVVADHTVYPAFG